MMGLRRLLTVLVLAIAGNWSAQAAAQLAFELRTGNAANNTQSMIVDTNKCPSEGPTSMYVGGVLTNTGSTTISGINAAMSGLNANIYLAGGQPASQAIGALGPGESIGIYWFTGYGCTNGAQASPTVTITSSAATVTRSLTLTIRAAISANAGGNVASATLGPGAVVGQTVYFDAQYDFGGSEIGDEFFLQPAGGQNFNAACFRLVGARITASNVTAAPVNAVDRLYFVQTAKQSGNGYFIAVRYSFEYQCAGTSSTARPYAVQTSGATNIKYTGNFDGTGSIAMTYPAATNPFTITKTVDAVNAFAGSTAPLAYTVTISNPSPYPSVVSRIVDVLPAGVACAALDPARDVTAANSSSVPPPGATGTVTFQGKLGRSYAIPAGGSVVLRYTATRPPGAGSFTNTARAFFGQAATPIAQATFQQVALQPLTATKVSAVLSDPLNAATNPKAIPGASLRYLIAVTNPNPLAVDADSVVISDPTPPALKFCPADLGAAGGGPIGFADGTPSSGLSYAFLGLGRTDDSLEFSSNGGGSWAYVPALDADGCDAAVTHFRVRPGGAFAGGGQFQLEARYRIK
ncbi:MAG: hypothetical protein ACEQR8_00190 [Cypionkella sp.]